MPKPQRTLPPGVDSLDNDITFGKMWIRIGTIKLIRTSNICYKVVCQFWGESTPAILSTRFDTPNNEQQRTQEYDVKCPVTFFVEYLQEMKNNFRLEVQGVGKLSIDITKFLKKTVNIDSRVAFENFKGFFEIMGKGNRKAGSLQIQMGSQFDPDIAVRELGESGVEQIRKSQILNCPAEKLQVRECCGHCECVCPKIPPKIRVQKQQIKEDDPRIAHSLDTKPRDQSSFDAKKYEPKQEQQKQGKKIQIVKKKSGEEDRSKQFPQVPKILTYSNLRLNYEDPQLQSQIKRHDNIIEEIKQSKEVEQHQLIQSERVQQIKPIVNIGIGESVEDSHFQIKAKPEISKQDLMKEFYGAENSPFKSNYEPIEQKSKDNFYKGEEVDKLSRVINLDQEFKHLKKVGPPPSLPFQLENSYSENRKMQMNPRRTGKSGLMLSLFVEISKQSIALPNKEVFVIAYRPYGQKERLTLGPNFTERIQIISNVGESEVRKMGKTPFIIQFWSANDTKFLGLVKIDLTKIKQGFLLQDRLNQIAIKTNLLPTTIHRGSMMILDLFDKQVGSCNLYGGIGTSNQLNNYWNQKQSQNLKPAPKKQPPKAIEDPQKQAREAKKEQKPIDNKNSVANYDTFLGHLYRNNNSLIDLLNKMMNQKYITRQQMHQLSKLIGLDGAYHIFELHSRLNEEGKTDIDFHYVADSFDDYIEIVQQLREQFLVCAKTVRNLFPDPNAILAQIRAQAPMKVISKKKAQEIMQKCSKYHEPIGQFLQKFSQYINVDNISAAFLNKDIEVPELAQINKDYINQLTTARVIAKLKELKITEDKFVELCGGLRKISVFQLFKSLQGKVSLWALLHWVEGILKKNSDPCSEAIDLPLLLKDLTQVGVPKIPQVKIPPQAPKQQVPQASPPKKPQISQPHQQKPIEPEQSNIIPPESVILQPVLPAEPQPKQQYYKHLFSIQPVEMSLDHPVKGNCVVAYEFPFEEEQVKSKNFQTFIDRHKYPLKMYGTHGFSIQDQAANYLGDNSVKFYVKVDKRIEYEGALPSDQLLIQPNTEEDKIIPLFCERSEGIAGKIKLNINYEKAAASENTLGKETTYQLFLPKSGYFNYSLSCQLQPTKIRSQLNLRQQFYVALVLDIFYNSPNLRTQFPPVSSKLYSDNSESIELSGSVKLSLTPVVLEYLKAKSARLSLNIIYYSKQSGNFERKEVPYAIIELPLINVIKTEGIKGDYAFKNKLGMFVTLANCALKYDKDPLAKQIGREAHDKNMASYWLVLSFLEFLNFEEQKFSWIRMEFVIRGRKYATDKINLQPYSINFLNNAAMLLKFTQQEFLDTKVIPITIITNSAQKLGIDVNVKAISKDIIHKKYSINNQNYVVVDRDSRATKMRLAMKTYCFRGGPLLANFVNSLYQHLDTEVFDEVEFPEQVQNYDQMLNIFKNKLKLTQKGLNQAISQLQIRNKEKINFEFFTNRTYYKLDFTPILAEAESDINFICEQLPTEANKEDIIQYFSDNKIKLQNFRPEFLDRYSFKELNRIKADKNIEFLGIEGQIDLISFVRKIKILADQSASNINQTSMMEDRVIELTILEGTNFQQLYNGIKPNSIVRIPEIGLQSQVSHRNSNPYFNQPMQFQLDKESHTMMRNLKIQVYHCTVDDDDAENILIGEGFLNVNLNDLRHSPKIVKVPITSLMSNKMKASLNIKVGIGQEKRKKRNETSGEVEESGDVSRLGDIMNDIKQEMAYKNKLFESSDQDYQ